MKTRQEITDIALLGILKQGCYCMAYLSGHCLYRGPGGLKCGIGMLIPDEKYTPELEDTTPTHPTDEPQFSKHPNIQLLYHVLSSVGVSLETYADQLFLRQLQDVHDNITASESFVERAQFFYRMNRLDLTAFEHCLTQHPWKGEPAGT